MSVAKNMMRSAYRAALGAQVLAALPLRRRDRIAVFYGGARPGDLGGTLVKVRLLQHRFPQSSFGFSLFYLLSNALYVPQRALEAVKKSEVPIVLNQNGVFYPGWHPEGWQIENDRMAKVHAIAGHVFYQSEFCRRCAERFLGARVGPSEILYNGVDVQHFRPRADVRREGPFRFLVTGKFGNATAYRLTSSIAGLSAARRGGLDCTLGISGYVETDVLQSALRQVADLNLTDAVTFTGPYNGMKAPEIYRDADAYLMTKYNDPCPNTVLEALSSGLPVLYSASGGVPELVGSDAGVGLPLPETFDEDLAPQPDAIADGMQRIVADRGRMAVAARERAIGRFALDGWLARHEAVFKSMVGAKAGSP